MSAAKTVGAFFDLDGTLLAPPSLEQRFLLYLIRRGGLGPAQAARWFAQLVRWMGSGWRSAIQSNKAYLAGLPPGLAGDWAAWIEGAALPWFDEGLRRLEWHAEQGHRIFLVSGSLAPLVRGAARRLPVRVEVCATELEVSEQVWTGRVRGDHLSFAAKARIVQGLAAQYCVDLAGSFAYGNCLADLAMLDTVRHPTAVNPSRRLERLAAQRGWPVVWWHATRGAVVSRQPEFAASAQVEAQR